LSKEERDTKLLDLKYKLYLFGSLYFVLSATTVSSVRRNILAETLREQKLKSQGLACVKMVNNTGSPDRQASMDSSHYSEMNPMIHKLSPLGLRLRNLQKQRSGDSFDSTYLANDEYKLRSGGGSAKNSTNNSSASGLDDLGTGDNHQRAAEDPGDVDDDMNSLGDREEEEDGSDREDEDDMDWEEDEDSSDDESESLLREQLMKQLASLASVVKEACEAISARLVEGVRLEPRWPRRR
jgi:hypothetical protein